ncbi:MAG: InlB B-repeat-containing protein [Clostridia bacterium]
MTKTNIRKRTISILLILMVMLTMTPMTASAAEVFVEVSTYEQLQTAVEKGDAKVKLVANIDTTNDNGGAGVTQKTALTFIGDGNILDLNGHTLKLVSNTGAIFFEVLKGLTIKDSGTGGRIDFEYGSSVIYRTTAIHVAPSAGAKLTVESGTLSSTEDGITLIKCEGNLTIKGGKIETPITNSGVTPQTIYTFNSYGDGCKILISGGEIYGTTVFTRDDSSVEKFPQDGNYPIQITGGTMKGRVIPVWIKGGEPTNQTEYSPVIEITGGVIHNWGRTGFMANCKRLPTKVVEGSFKDGAIISVGDVKKTSEICVAALGQSAIRYNDEYGPSSQICRGNGIPGGTVNNGGIAFYGDEEDTPVTVIPNAWGIKSVKLDGKEISYAKDWNGEPIEIDNSKDHTLTYEWYPLLQGLQDCGYKYDAMFQRYYAGDSGGHGDIITSGTQYSYTIKKGIDPKLYTFNLALDMLHNGKPFLNGHNNHAVKLMVKEAPPTPTIEGNVYYTSGIVYGSPISIAASVTPAEATKSYQWQRSTDGGSTWTNIEGATSGRYTPVAADMGENVRIRVKVTAEGYLGEIIGAALKVNKADNNNYPEVIKLEAVKDGTGNYNGFKITNFDPNCEYVYSTTDKPNWSANQITSATAQITSTTATVTGLTSNTTYYVFARFKETATHTAGSIVSKNSIMLYDYVPLDRVSLEGYDSGNTIYIKKGESVTLKVSADPSNANSWSKITFKDEGATTSNIAISNGTINASTGTATPFPNGHTITITGVSTGSANLRASYPSATSSAYGTWYVVVYDDSTVADALRLENVYAYEDITLSENDEAELPTELPKLLPEKSGYHLEWRILKRGTTGVAHVTENDNIKLEDDKIKPKTAHTGSEKTQLELVAVKDGSTTIKLLAKTSPFYVTVTEAPTVELTGVTVAPTKVNLELNATYQLSAVKEPVNAAGSLTWTSDKPDVAAVSSTGEVTAKAQGTAIITVSCGDKKATCTVTVDHQHDYSGQPYLYLDPGNHYQECTAGDGYNIQAHEFTAWTDNGNGTHSRHCTVCKMTDGSTYTETAEHTWVWVVDQEAALNQPGRQHEECTGCNAKRSENTVIPALKDYAVAVTGGKASDATGATITRAMENATITITAQAPIGQHFVKWVVKAGGVTLANETSTTTTFTMPANNVTIEASFEKNASSGGYVPTVQKPEITIIGSGKADLSADGRTATITANAGHELVSVVLNGKEMGKVEKLTGLKTGDKATITFQVKTDGKAEMDKMIAQKASKLTLMARSKKTAKMNIKVVVKGDLKAITDAGYTVKYKFYRSTKKSAGYKAMLTKKAPTYFNTYGKKGTMYYYKAKVMIYDKDGNFVAQTALKQCKYANRLWTK